MPAETLDAPAIAERPQETPSPVGKVDIPTPPEKSKPEGKPDLVSGLLSQWLDLQKKRGEILEKFAPELAAAEAKISGAEKQGQDVAREVVAPALVDQFKAASQPVPPVPKAIPEPPVPENKARPFLTGAKEPLTALVNGLGLLAQLGMAGMAPVTALNALSGAMQGWAKGDSERADREWQHYLATVDSIRHENRQLRETFDMSMRASGANLAQAEARTVAALGALGLTDRATQVAKDGYTRSLGRLGMETQNLDHVEKFTGDLMKWVGAHELAVATQSRADAMAEETMRSHRENEKIRLEDIRQRAIDRKASLEERAQAHREFAANRQMMQQILLQAPQGSLYWDKSAGEVRPPTKAELIEDEQRRAKGEKTQFSRVINTQVPLIDRLAVAGPVLDALDKLIDRINAEAPGENITQGLINRLKQRAGIGPDIQQFMTLKLDAALENAAALSGGQPRISILHMLRGEAQPNEFMTKDTAKLVNETTRTTIKNRLSKVTGDPNAYDALQAGQVPYALFDKSASTGAKGKDSGWKIELVPGSK